MWPLGWLIHSINDLEVGVIWGSDLFYHGPPVKGVSAGLLIVYLGRRSEMLGVSLAPGGN
jgi:hypothetical protein